MQIPLVDLKTQYQSLSKEIDKVIKDVCMSSSFIKGPPLDKFEQHFSKFIGTKYSVGVSSGTDALHLSLLALEIKSGDEVIVPANTFIATVYAVLYIGAKPILTDIDGDTYNINIYDLEKKINKKTKAIIPVHLYGQPSNMKKIMHIAKVNKLFVIEDACQSHGANHFNRRTGTFGDIAAFSFYPGKNLGAYGDGGAITTNSLDIANKIKKLREYGSVTKYLHEEIGFNSRLDALQAAILDVKLKKLETWNKRRQSLAKYYDKRFSKDVPQIKIPYIDEGNSSVYHLYVIRTQKRDALQKYLSSKGIQTGIHYPIPLHLQKSLKHLGYKKGDFKITEKVAGEILSLPMYPELTNNQQDYIVESIKSFF